MKIDEISSLSSAEFINIVGHYQHLVTGKSDVNPDLEARGYSPQAIAEAKKLSTQSFTPVVSQGLKFTKPLNNFNSDILGYALLLFDNYERGQLPFPGAVSEQPAQIIEIFGLLQALRSEQEDKHRRKMERNVRNQHQSQSRASR